MPSYFTCSTCACRPAAPLVGMHAIIFTCSTLPCACRPALRNGSLLDAPSHRPVRPRRFTPPRRIHSASLNNNHNKACHTTWHPMRDETQTPYKTPLHTRQVATVPSTLRDHGCGRHTAAHTVHQLGLRTAYGLSKIGELAAKTVPKPCQTRDMGDPLGSSRSVCARTDQSKVGGAVVARRKRSRSSFEHAGGHTKNPAILVLKSVRGYNLASWR